MAETWTYSDLQNSIRRRELHPLYLFYGDETFLIGDALTELSGLGLEEAQRDFNLTTFFGQDAEPEQVVDAVKTLPMLAPVRLVILKEAQEMTDKDWDTLMEVIDSPVESTSFICIASKVDKRKKYMKRFGEQGVVVEFKRPYDNQVPQWIEKLGGRHGLRLNGDVISVLLQVVGTNLSDLNSEIGKLAQNLGERKTPTVEDVLHVVSHSRFDSVFDLTDAIGNNDRARALQCLANLLDQGQNEVGILALISRHVRILQLILEGVREGMTGAKLCSKAGIAPYFLKSYQGQIKFWNQQKIERTLAALLDTDRALKSSPVSSPIWLENFILQTCG